MKGNEERESDGCQLAVAGGGVPMTVELPVERME
ncbi:uncharacterized protein G2W53_027693 [Senna tora]|uniref:Uncharacterized protein n=1 Tax=Senna tora TaxID=362788 RepID=A0A834SWH6_9FABA|nr:uncharacterized protein G2W53_032305 [Senna tora]KAF7822236.1 uncharacterized protein G2W53_027691 [Senna tora]KAF7822238.1 uncharacterized protein G2W53_027693 [Senna tora]